MNVSIVCQHCVNPQSGHCVNRAAAVCRCVHSNQHPHRKHHLLTLRADCADTRAVVCAISLDEKCVETTDYSYLLPLFERSPHNRKYEHPQVVGHVRVGVKVLAHSDHHITYTQVTCSENHTKTNSRVTHTNVQKFNFSTCLGLHAV